MFIHVYNPKWMVVTPKDLYNPNKQEDISIKDLNIPPELVARVRIIQYVDGKSTTIVKNSYGPLIKGDLDTVTNTILKKLYAHVQ